MTTKPMFAELPSRALIAVGGPDWRSFLHGLITQNVETLASGEARFAALLTPQGRLLWDLFVVGRQDDGWRVDDAYCAGRPQTSIYNPPAGPCR